MDTLHEMREYVLKLYNESLKRFPLSDEDTEKFLEEEELTDDEQNRITYIVDMINSMDTYIKDDFISLLLLYYYIISVSYTLEDDDIGYQADEEFEEEKDEIIDMLEQDDYNNILEYFTSMENTDLFDIILFIIQEDIVNYGELGLEKIDDFDEYIHLNALGRRKFDLSEVMQKLHPNLELEEERYNEYLKNESYVRKIQEKKFNNYLEFVQTFELVKYYLTSKSYVEDLLKRMLHSNSENKELIKKVNLYIMKYYFIKKYYENPDNYEELLLEISKRVQEADEIDYMFLRPFVDYSMNDYLYSYANLPGNVKNSVDEIINLDNSNNYGNEGIWKKYDDSCLDLLLKYSPSWIDVINFEKGKYDINIYYSIDSKGKYTIPRLCIFYDVDKVTNVLGRRNGFNVELDLIDILDYKVQEYNYDKKIMDDILSLKFIKYIQNKIDNNEELTNEEFEYLYGIDGNINCYLFDRYDNVIHELRNNKNQRTILAHYYGCMESEVALNESELNENTVVTTFFFIKNTTCNFPKLKVIFTSAWGVLLKSVEGLPSLEFILDDATFDRVESSKGLENLIFIGGSADFSQMEDTSYLNKNLIILGEVKFKDGYEPDSFQKRI